MIALITGEVGCGKTTVCGRTVELLRGTTVRLGGILAPARLDDGGSKIGIDAIDVATGERRPLANRILTGGETIGTYTFDPASLTWAVNRLLAAAVRPGLAWTSRVLIVDEIGPLELVRQDGFVAILDPLSSRDVVPHALVVVRRAFADILTERLSRPDVRQFRVDAHNREEMPAEIASLLST